MNRVAAGLCVFALIAFSQAFSSLSGTVTDPTGAVIPGASIAITNRATGQSRETNADAQGLYALFQVLPGPYKLHAKAAGFSDLTTAPIELLVNSPATVSVAFQKLGSQTDSVTVEATASQINTSRRLARQCRRDAGDPGAAVLRAQRRRVAAVSAWRDELRDR